MYRKNTTSLTWVGDHRGHQNQHRDATADTGFHLFGVFKAKIHDTVVPNDSSTTA